MPLSDAEVHEIVNRHRGSTDSGETADVPALWFRDAINGTERNPDGGPVAVEIGVRAGGMSAIFCDIAKAIGTECFMVLSVDPYGLAPYYSPRKIGTDYDEIMYVAAKRRLADFPNSAMFRMTASDFLTRVLPDYRWWYKGNQYPSGRRFVAFAYVDGQHDDVSVVSEVAALVPHMTRGGMIAIDNTEACPAAVEMLSASARFHFTKRIDWSGKGTSYDYLRRVAFTIP